MKSLCLVLVVVCATAANKLGNTVRMTPRAQQVGEPGTPVLLPHPNLPFVADSELSAQCNGGFVTLTYTPKITGKLLSFVVGSHAGNPACKKEDIEVTDGTVQVITTTAEIDCGRDAEVTAELTPAYRWQVLITEEEWGGDIAREFQYSVTMLCNADAESPQGNQVPPQVAEQEDQGQANYLTTIPFTLVKTAASTAKQWVFDLKPENVADLFGVSYTIVNCLATPEGEAAPSVALITEGCVSERTTTVNTVETTNTISVLAFRFKGSPLKQVVLTCTVKLCIPEEGATNCPGVTSAEDCDTGAKIAKAQPKRTPRSLHIASLVSQQPSGVASLVV